MWLWKSLNSYLYSIGKHPDGHCEVCLIPDDVKHLLLECRKYITERNYLKERLAENNHDPSLKTLLSGARAPFNEVIWFVKKCQRGI